MSSPKNIILLSVDALRADHCSCHGYERETTPNLDRFAADNVQFSNAYSASSHTPEAIPALLTGRYPDVAVDDAVIWEAYRENLELVLPHVERLLDTIPGKTVVTSDHGNMIGESSFPVPVREYGHPDGIYTPELVTVPWHVYTNGERREITTQEREQTSESESSSDISDRLEALGYDKPNMKHHL